MPDLTRFRQMGLALTLLFATLVVAVGGTSSYRKILSFQPLGFEYETRAGSWLVTSVDADTDKPVIESGDRILLVNGDGPGVVSGLDRALGRRADSEIVVMRSGELLTLEYQPPPLRIDFAYLILALTACVYLLIGFYTLLRDLRPPTLLFLLWCLTSAAVYLITVTPPYDWLDRASYMLEELARIVLAPLTLHLFTVFPQPLAGLGRLRRATPFLYIPASFLALLQADLVFFNGANLFGGAVASALPLLDRLELLHLAVFGLCAVFVLVRRLMRTEDPAAQRQATWIAIGTATGYVPFLALYVAPLLVGLDWPQLPSALAVLPLAVVPLTFSYAILRYKLWDIGVVVRDTLSLSLTILLGVSGFALANLVVDRVIPDDLALGRNLLVFASGLMIAGLMVPTRRSVNRSLERLQYRDSFNRRRELESFGRELLEERDLERLTSRLRDRILDCLDTEPSNLLLVRQDGFEIQLPESGLPRIFTSAVFDGEFWSKDVVPLSAISLIESDPCERRLFAAGYRYAFPLKVREQLLGIFLVGHQTDGIPLSSDDLQLLRRVCDQTALALDNSRLLERVQRQLDEVGRLQQFSQSIIDSSPAGIAVLDAQNRILSANSAFARIVGSAPGSLEGAPLSALLPEADLPAPEDGIREIRHGHGDDQQYLQVSTATIRGSSPEDGRVLVVQDVSERVAMEHALEESDRLAALGVLAAGVAHEVNTPITGISSYAQMLLADTTEEDPHYPLLKKVEKQTFRAARIVNNLLNFARKRSGERAPLDIVALLDECLDLSRERLSRRGISLLWEPPGKPVDVFGNESELQQVFTNLILNAIDAMAGQEEGRLTVEIARDEQWASVSIEDSGTGIAPEELESIFRPFYSTKVAQGGTGLGLSISHDIIRRHGGDVRVVSTPGRGSRFVVELPRKETPGTEEA
jgi:PAS domain S-box-containing protein